MENLYVYALSNPSMPGLVKIGVSSNVEERRARLSSSTSVPTPFELVGFIEVDDGYNIEMRIHSVFDQWCAGKEFFRVNVETVLALFALLETVEVARSLEVNEKQANNPVLTEQPRAADIVVFENQTSYVTDYIRKFFAQVGRLPSIPEVSARFPDMAKTTIWRRIDAVRAEISPARDDEPSEANFVTPLASDATQ